MRGYKSKVLRGLGGRRENQGGVVVLGPHRRLPKQWFTPTIDNELPSLVEKISETRGDLAIKDVAGKL